MGRSGTTGTTPGGQGRFAGFDALGQADAWDEVTRAVVVARLGPRPPIRFFTPAEEALARPLFDRLLAQDQAPRVPVFEMIDARLADGLGDGFRYADMPEDGDAFRRSLAAVDADAWEKFDSSFADLAPAEQRLLLEEVRTAGDWHGLPGARVWSLWTRYAVHAFYAHPWAWNEIGFPGPAYPRGYKNLGAGRGPAREPFEEPELEARDPEPWARRVERARRVHGA